MADKSKKISGNRPLTDYSDLEDFLDGLDACNAEIAKYADGIQYKDMLDSATNKKEEYVQKSGIKACIDELMLQNLYIVDDGRKQEISPDYPRFEISDDGHTLEFSHAAQVEYKGEPDREGEKLLRKWIDSIEKAGFSSDKILVRKYTEEATKITRAQPYMLIDRATVEEMLAGAVQKHFDFLFKEKIFQVNEKMTELKKVVQEAQKAVGRVTSGEYVEAEPALPGFTDAFFDRLKNDIRRKLATQLLGKHANSNDYDLRRH